MMLKNVDIFFVNLLTLSKSGSYVSTVAVNVLPAYALVVYRNTRNSGFFFLIEEHLETN